VSAPKAILDAQKAATDLQTTGQTALDVLTSIGVS
jgi:hypothetical protein